VASLFEGLVDDAVASVGTIRSSHATATTLYDLIPMASGEGLPTAASVDWYHRKIASLKRSDLLLALSDHARAQAVAQLPMQADACVVVSTAASEVFRPGALPPTLFPRCVHVTESRARSSCMPAVSTHGKTLRTSSPRTPGFRWPFAPDTNLFSSAP
jgi:hypothetical protein